MLVTNRNAYRRAVLAAVLVMLFSTGVRGAVITPELEAELAVRASSDEVAVIVTMSDKVNHRLFEVKDRHQRNTRLFKALKDKSVATQEPLRTLLQNNQARRVRELWMINGVAMTIPASLVGVLARLPGVERIQLDSMLQVPVTAAGTPAPPEWNLNAVHVPELWSLGYTGSGVVVANMDTGVDPNHPDLAGKWRGGSNSWYDPHGEHASPYDPNGHGTQTMGIIVGGASGGTAIGVAPDATWVAVKLYNDAGQASYSDIHLAFQWLLDPDGDLNTVDAPDVVNASWGLVGTAGQCITDFNPDIDVLKAAGTAVAFAAGNDGSASLTSLSPANNPAGFSTGAVDSTLTIADFSSRGPSACDGNIYPKMTAPGVSIRTADLSFGGQPFYMVVTGTSFAAPHTAGVMALLAGAFPQASVSDLEAAMTGSAQDIGVPGADNSYGYGLDNALAAYQILLTGANHPPTITSIPPTTAVPGSPYTYVVKATDPDGDAIAFSLSLAPAGMTINATTGVIGWIPGSAQAGANAVTVRVADSHGVAATQSFSVMVTAINAAPIAANDVYSMAAGSALSVPAPGALSNDGDPNGGSLTVVLLSGPSRGRLTLNSNGSFSYIPNARFTGTDSFIYRAYDGALFSNNATVSIKVTANKPPVANNDSATAPYRQTVTYTPVVISVLANDFDADGSIDPASIAVVNAPNRGGTVVVNANGTVSYTPKKGLRGIETFRYSVRDNLGSRSNPARVIIRVK